MIDSSVNLILQKNYMTIAEFCMLDIISTNNFERPVYFATTVGSDNFLGFENYFSYEALAYKITPVKTENPEQYNPGKVYSDVLYSKLFDKLHFNKAYYQKNSLCENQKNMINVYREMFAKLANQLIIEDKKDKALHVLDYCIDAFPVENTQYNYSILDFIQNYFKIGQEQKARNLLDKYSQTTTNEIERLIKLKKTGPGDSEIRMQVSIFNELMRISEEFIPNDEITKNLNRSWLKYKSYYYY
jgi:hypothetical protein